MRYLNILLYPSLSYLHVLLNVMSIYHPCVFFSRTFLFSFIFQNHHFCCLFLHACCMKTNGQCHCLFQVLLFFPCRPTASPVTPISNGYKQDPAEVFLAKCQGAVVRSLPLPPVFSVRWLPSYLVSCWCWQGFCYYFSRSQGDCSFLSFAWASRVVERWRACVCV